MRGLIWVPVLALAAVVPVHGREIIVDLSGGGEFIGIQPAIDAAVDGDTVLVKPGEYVITEPIDFNRLHDPENPGSPPAKNIVVRSEVGATETAIRMAEEPADLERASVVIFENGEDEESLLEGFTLTGGKGMHLEISEAPSQILRVGGGVVCRSESSPTLANCAIVENGALIYPAFPVLPAAGGGVFCLDSSPILDRCQIRGNRAHGGSTPCGPPQCSGTGYPGMGGGFYCERSSPLLVNCSIAGNLAKGGSAFGGGAPGRGGGVYCTEGAPTLMNCTISGDVAEGGGGMSQGPGSGGGVYCYDSRTTFWNCTITGNTAWSPLGRGWGSGIGCAGRSILTVTNCIVWRNRFAPSVEIEEAAFFMLTYCVVDGEPLWPGIGNTNVDPVFTELGHWLDDATPRDRSDDIWVEGDYRLQPASPCIDAGRSEGAPDTDIEGNTRPCGSGVDIGAYEYCPKPFVRGNANAQGFMDISDGIFVLNFLFLGGPEPPCMDAADINDSGTIDISDGIGVFNFLFLDWVAPAAPFPDCGADETKDELACESYSPCE